jgi:hypothetical protein
VAVEVYDYISSTIIGLCVIVPGLQVFLSPRILSIQYSSVVDMMKYFVNVAVAAVVGHFLG